MIMVKRDQDGGRAYGLGSLMRGTYQRGRYGGIANPLAYSVSRFAVVRQLGQVCRRFQTRPKMATTNVQQLKTTDSNSIVEELRRSSYSKGLSLDPSSVAEIHDYADKTPCVIEPNYRQGERLEFLRRDWREAESQSGRRIFMGRLPDCARQCSVIGQIENDERLHEIASAYFGYRPNWVQSRLYWSFCRSESEELRRARSGQNVLFHYDLCGFRWKYLFFQFYVTRVDAGCGPMVVVRGSHGRKPLRMLWGSANQSQSAIDRCYGTERIESVEGEAGEGFVMDGFCFHRASVPTSSDRLMLQIRMA